MGAFFQQYGVEDERRSRIFWRVLWSLLTLLVIATIGYFVLHNLPEKQVASRFLDEVNARRFEEAYHRWGCTAEHPCPNYDYQRFLQDWGPGRKTASPWKIVSTDSCRAFLTVNVAAQGADLESLSVQRADKSLGFAPSPECQEMKWRWNQFFARIFGGGASHP